MIGRALTPCRLRPPEVRLLEARREHAHAVDPPALARRAARRAGASHAEPRGRAAYPRPSRSRRRARCEIVGPPGGDDRAAGKNHDPVADELDLAQQVRVEEDADLGCAAPRAARGPSPAGRVERARRLVEQQYRRGPDERLRDPEPLLHPLRHRSTRRRGRSRARRARAAAAFGVAARRAGESLVEAEHLVGGVPARKTEELSEVAERRPGRRRSRRRSADLRAAAGGADQAASDLDEGRFAGAIRSERPTVRRVALPD